MIPVILQSARNDPRDLAEGIEAGAYYYLEKPIHAEMLRQVVGAALRDHRRVYGGAVGGLTSLCL